MPTVGSHQQGAFATPVNGQSIDASVVLSNDNATRTTTNAHDADATIHISSSVLASRPAAGTAGRVWVTSDGLRAYMDSGSVWNELDYLSKTGGGTVAASVTISAGGLTVSSGTTAVQALTATTVTATGAIQLGDAQQVQWAGSNNAIRFTGTTFQLYPNGVLGFSVAAGGVGVLAGGLTVSSGTTAVQALTATSGTFTASIGSSASAPFVASNPTPGSLHQVLTSSGSTTGAVSISFANTGNSQLLGIESSAGGLLFAGTSAYSAVFGTSSARSIHLVTNNAVRLTIDSAGAVSGISSLSATSLAGTLTTAAQPNITSVGVLASTHLTSPVIDSGGLTVTAGDVLISSGIVKSSAQGMFGPWNGAGDAGSLCVSNNTASSATGGAQTLPANPVGFFLWKLGASTVKVPYYNT